MDAKKARRRIIDSSAVSRQRRSARRTSEETRQTVHTEADVNVKVHVERDVETHRTNAESTETQSRPVSCHVHIADQADEQCRRNQRPEIYPSTDILNNSKVVTNDKENMDILVGLTNTNARYVSRTEAQKYKHNSTMDNTEIHALIHELAERITTTENYNTKDNGPKSLEQVHDLDVTLYVPLRRDKTHEKQNLENGTIDDRPQNQSDRSRLRPESCASSLWPGNDAVPETTNHYLASRLNVTSPSENCVKSEIGFCGSPINFEYFEKRRSSLLDMFGEEDVLSSIIVCGSDGEEEECKIERKPSLQFSDTTLKCYNTGEGFFGSSSAMSINSQQLPDTCAKNHFSNFDQMYQKMMELEQSEHPKCPDSHEAIVNAKASVETTAKTDSNAKKQSELTKFNPLQYGKVNLESKDPFSIELELTRSDNKTCDKTEGGELPDLFEAVIRDYERDLRRLEGGSPPNQQECKEAGVDTHDEEASSAVMDSADGTPRLLSVEEKWQIIFNEKTRAPIYAVAQYVDYLTQFVSGSGPQGGAAAVTRERKEAHRKDGIHPISYLLRKLKLDLKMSYDSFVEEFLRPGNDGMALLVKLLKSIQTLENRQSGSTNMAQLKHYKKTLTDEHDCLLCIKYSMRLKSAMGRLLEINYGLETVATSLISTYTKARGTAIEILTVAMSTSEGFPRILECFTYIQLKIGEPVRFKSLMNMLNMDSVQNTIFKVSTMKFLNTLLDASTNTNIRVYLQHELESAGLDIDFMTQKATGTGLEHDDLRHELAEWKRKYVNVDSLMTSRGNVIQQQDQTTRDNKIEDLQSKLQRLSDEKKVLEQKLKQVSGQLRINQEELRHRVHSRCDAFTQCYAPSTESVGCQCGVPASSTNSNDADDSHQQTAAQLYGWKDAYVTGNEEAVFYPQLNYDVRDTGIVNADEVTSDDEGVEKVEHWLRSHCSSSDVSKCADDMTGAGDEKFSLDSKLFRFQRNSISRRKVGKTEFPGNWKLIPKSIEQFPSRFPIHQCHDSQCDRCDVTRRTENRNDDSGVPGVSDTQTASVELRLHDLVKNDVKRRSDVKSQSSDSAIGGSGDRLWNDRRVPPLLKPEVSEAEILQDLIQPEDSASACPLNEPYVDYPPVRDGYKTHRSFRSELSHVLREFEGTLNRYDVAGKPIQEVVEHYVSLGDV